MRTLACILAVFALAAGAHAQKDDATRAKELSELRMGMFVCWSLSTFSGHEWTRGVTSPDYFKATGCDTDQWCQTAKAAGMGYILFLTKHHDGFCLWDTKTTEFKSTNSPLKMDVLAELRKSCDKHGLKLALYFSEGDWTWIKEPLPQDGMVPGSPKWGDPVWSSGKNTDLKKEQLRELLTGYGPIAFFWMDHAQGDGGLGHKETAAWVKSIQPDCFVGFNHGEPAGDLCLREMGRPGPVGDANASEYNKEAEGAYKGYLAAEFTYPILPPHEGGAMWFYSLPMHDQLCLPAKKLFKDHQGAVRHNNIFSIDVGPNYEGRLRDIDAATLRELGAMIKDGGKTAGDATQ